MTLVCYSWCVFVYEIQKRWQARVGTEAKGVNISSHVVFDAALSILASKAKGGVDDMRVTRGRWSHWTVGYILLNPTLCPCPSLSLRARGQPA